VQRNFFSSVLKRNTPQVECRNSDYFNDVFYVEFVFDKFDHHWIKFLSFSLFFFLANISVEVYTYIVA